MSMLITGSIWAAARCERAKMAGRVTVVSPYVTSDLLGLSIGDRLLCDASEQQIRGAATDAATLRDLLGAGVTVYHVERLHAKLIRLPGALIVGSSNMTANTLKLSEAALLTHDRGALTHADGFVRQLLARKTTRRLTQLEVKQLLTIEVECAGGGDRSHKARRGSRPAGRLWLSRVDPMSARHARLVGEQLGEVLNDGEPFDGEVIVYDMKHGIDQVQMDDYLLQVHPDGRVLAPHLIGGLHNVKLPVRGKLVRHRAIVGEDVQYIFRAWGPIQRILHEHGIWRRRGRPELVLIGGEARDAVLARFKMLGRME